MPASLAYTYKADMFYLLASIVGASSLIIILKLFELKNVNNVVGITVNYLVGAAFAFAFAPHHLPAGEIVAAPWFSMSLIIGAMFMLSFMVYALSAQRSGVAITAISGRSAMAIPTIFAFVVLGEQPTTIKIAMLALLLVSLPLIIYKKSDGASKAKVDKLLIILPLVVFVYNGINDTLVQFAQKTKVMNNDETAVFMGTMFLAGAVTGALYYLVKYCRKLYVPTGRDILWGAILGFANWVCMAGVLFALNVMDGSVFFPLYYSGAIVLSTLVGVLAFKEKLSLVNYIGMTVAIVAIAVLAMQ